MLIKPSVINTFKRVGIDYKPLLEKEGKIEVYNRFGGGGSCEVSPLVAYLIAWVYQISNDYEDGKQEVNISDFDRVRHFILEVDNNAYMTCID